MTMADLENIPGAVPGPMPGFIAPELATLGESPPRGEGWLHEPKIDGDRVGARIENGHVTLFSRKEQDYTTLLPKIAGELRALPVKTAWLDGEIAILDSRGFPSFPLLRARLHKRDPRILYFVFDL